MRKEKFKYQGSLAGSNWRRSRAVFLGLEDDQVPLLEFDIEKSFNLITYSYTNKDLYDYPYKLSAQPDFHAKFSSDGAGESVFILSKLFKGRFQTNLTLPSDNYVTISELNRLFDIADLFSLDVYQISLSKDSYFSHPHTVNRPGLGIEEAPFAEWVGGGMSSQIWDAINELGVYSISGYGMDAFLIPAIQRKMGLKPPAIVHYCQMHQVRPVSSLPRVFRNGLTSMKELQLIRKQVEHLSTVWHDRLG